MTIKEAAQLVILASSISEQHRTYILEMGKQKNILKLAKELILLNGLIPIQGNYKKPGKMNIIFTGLKNGEKLKEKLFISDNVSNTKLDKIKFIDEPTLEGDYIENFIQEMINDFKNQKIEKLIHNLKQITGLRV
jgi:FlaA1/EpsC-like NDP-sugar epimerase